MSSISGKPIQESVYIELDQAIPQDIVVEQVASRG
jgi:hypothetical protein